MAYSKQTWNNDSVGGTPISAARLNNIENGIAYADDDLGSGTAFPATPRRGQVFLRTDLGLGVLFMWDGRNWCPMNPGQIQGKAWLTVNQSLPLQSYFIVPFGASRLLGGFTWDPTNTALKVPLDGFYRIIHHNYLYNSTGSTTAMFLATRIRAGVSVVDVASNMVFHQTMDQQQTATDVVPLLANDSVQLRAYSYSAGNAIAGQGESNGNTLYMEYVAPLNGAAAV
jgi:hypothetical protein